MCLCVCVCVWERERERAHFILWIIIIFSVVSVCCTFWCLDDRGRGLPLKALWLKASHFHRHDRWLRSVQTQTVPSFGFVQTHHGEHSLCICMWVPQCLSGSPLLLSSSHQNVQQTFTTDLQQQLSLSLSLSHTHTHTAWHTWSGQVLQSYCMCKVGLCTLSTDVQLARLGPHFLLFLILFKNKYINL